MDYSKLTKAELIEKIENAGHLATTVRHKDKVISELKTEINLLKKEIQETSDKERIELVRVNKELVNENREVFGDMRYLLQVFDVFLSNFSNNTQLVKILLKKYLNEGDK